MKKLLVICGPTATGKTGLGLKLAKKFNGEIVSADSRQVYKGMDIGTGKDLPKISNFQFPISNLKLKNFQIGYYEVKGVRIWLYDIVEPDYLFNVSGWIKCAELVIKDVFRRDKLPILVGGTGFYLKTLIENIPSQGIPPNWLLRTKLELKSPESLFEELAEFDSFRAGQMNISDRKNKRRLIRAIEIARWRVSNRLQPAMEKLPQFDALFIGLKAPLKILYQKIDKRVDEQIKMGAEAEVKKLIRQGFRWNLPSMSAMGYIEWQPFFERETTRDEIIARWKFDEHAYARRQMTWFKKQKSINWFDITKKGWENDVEKKVLIWYTQRNAKKN